MFFNKETGIVLAYRPDFYRDVGVATSLLFYAKGDASFPIMLLIFSLNY